MGASVKKRSRTAEDPAESVAELRAELRAIRQLMTLLLAKIGADSQEIGMALGVSPSTVRNSFSFRQVEVIQIGTGGDDE